MTDDGDLIGFVNESDEKDPEEVTAAKENSSEGEGCETSKPENTNEEATGEVLEQKDGIEKVQEAPGAAGTGVEGGGGKATRMEK